MKTVIEQLNKPKEDTKNVYMDADKVVGEVETRHYASGYVQCSGWFMLPKVEA